MAFLVYQSGTLITEGTVGTGFLPGLVAVLAMTGIIGYLMVRGGKDIRK